MSSILFIEVEYYYLSSRIFVIFVTSGVYLAPKNQPEAPPYIDCLDRTIIRDCQGAVRVRSRGRVFMFK